MKNAIKFNSTGLWAEHLPHLPQLEAKGGKIYKIPGEVSPQLAQSVVDANKGEYVTDDEVENAELVSLEADAKEAKELAEKEVQEAKEARELAELEELEAIEARELAEKEALEAKAAKEAGENLQKAIDNKKKKK